MADTSEYSVVRFDRQPAVRFHRFSGYRHFRVHSYDLEVGGYPVSLALVAPFDETLASWIKASLTLRFTSHENGGARATLRPSVVCWSEQHGGYLLIMRPFQPLISFQRGFTLEISIDSNEWRVLAFHDPAPASANKAIYTHKAFYARQIQRLAVRYRPCCQTLQQATRLCVEVETDWAHVGWLRNNASLRVRLIDGRELSAVITGTEAYLLEVTRLTADFAPFASTQISKVEIVIATESEPFCHTLWQS